MYHLMYPSLFGGVVAFNKKHFEAVNGFSNKFWGWGGEDDDMWNRVKGKGLSVIRYKEEIARQVTEFFLH
jgi:predicted glycosyltransferase involved in capsule biosynthesis